MDPQVEPVTWCLCLGTEGCWRWQLGGDGGPRAMREAPPNALWGEASGESVSETLGLKNPGRPADRVTAPNKSTENLIQSPQSAASRETESPAAVARLWANQASASFTFNTAFQRRQPGGHWGHWEDECSEGVWWWEDEVSLLLWFSTEKHSDGDF